MQKNKFIHEDIKAVCSSAAKKLVALGLAVAVGGANFSLTAVAQTPEELDREIAERLEAVKKVKEISLRERERERLIALAELLSGTRTAESILNYIRETSAPLGGEQGDSAPLRIDTLLLEAADKSSPEMPCYK